MVVVRNGRGVGVRIVVILGQLSKQKRRVTPAPHPYASILLLISLGRSKKKKRCGVWSVEYIEYASCVPRTLAAGRNGEAAEPAEGSEGAARNSVISLFKKAITGDMDITPNTKTPQMRSQK